MNDKLHMQLLEDASIKATLIDTEHPNYVKNLQPAKDLIKEYEQSLKDFSEGQYYLEVNTQLLSDVPEYMEWLGKLSTIKKFQNVRVQLKENVREHHINYLEDEFDMNVRVGKDAFYKRHIAKIQEEADQLEEQLKEITIYQKLITSQKAYKYSQKNLTVRRTNIIKKAKKFVTSGDKCINIFNEFESVCYTFLPINQERSLDSIIPDCGMVRHKGKKLNGKPANKAKKDRKSTIAHYNYRVGSYIYPLMNTKKVIDGTLKLKGIATVRKCETSMNNMESIYYLTKQIPHNEAFNWAETAMRQPTELTKKELETTLGSYMKEGNLKHFPF